MRSSMAIAILATALATCSGLLARPDSPPPPPEPAPGAPAQEPARLRIGDPAPTLAGARWIQGGPIDAWEPGKVYVLDFWATWCAPCVASIPHMNEMHQRIAAKGGSVIGVAVWKQDGQKPTDEYVTSRKAEMTYPVAEDVDDAMSGRFMVTTGSDGIPTAMIVDQKGRMVWVGHPMAGLDEAVEQTMRGAFDVDGAAKKAELRERAEVVLNEANAAAEEGDWAKAIERLDAVIAMGYEAPFWTLTRAQLLIAMAGRPDDGYAAIAAAVRETLNDEPELLQRVAWFIAETPGLERRDWALAEAAAARALAIKGDADPMALETTARVAAAQEQWDRAVDFQKRAIANVKDARLRERMGRTLAQYEQTRAANPATP